MPQLELIAATAFGLEAVVVRELENLGYAPTVLSTGRVLFRGELAAICRANMWLRAADRVLIRVGTFPATDFGQLFDGVRALPWEEWVAKDAAFPVTGRSVKSQLSSVPACQKIVKKAIVERLKAAHGVEELPESAHRVAIEISMLGDVATLTIDTSGDGLHKRGYRQLIGEAQLKETLAAGLVLLSVWRPNRPLVDPFCGSGTIPIEAALIGRNIAPGLYRTFDAVEWGIIPDAVWDAADEEAKDLAVGKLAYPIHGYDISEDALSLARHHAKRAGVADVVRFSQRDFKDLTSKLEYGCIITNPPYGERIGRGRELEDLYRGFPHVLRHLPTWSTHVLTSWDDLEALVGQSATRRRKLFNAQIECTYYQFLGPRPPKGMNAGEEAVVPAESATADVAVEEPAAHAVVPAHVDRPVDPPAGPQAGFGGLRPRDIKEIEEFAACLANNARHLRKYPSRGITCYRVYERDMPDVPVIIDRYEDAVHIAEYEREHSRTPAQQADWLDAVAMRAGDVLGVDRRRVFVKNKHRQRGLTQHERVADERKTFVVHEGGLQFEVNLSDYVDTGLFLDHRLTRGMVREEAAGKRVLNLFCYTGSFTVYAASGGAEATTSVDLSNTYLEWAGRNLELNGLEWWGEDARANAAVPRAGHRLVRGDVMEWLREQRTVGERGSYDLAIVDPPTFSNSKRTDDVFDVQRDHAEMLGLVANLLSPKGVVYFSNNNRRFKLDEAGLVEAGYSGREISRRTVPPEYRNTRIHRCWRLVRGGGAEAGGVVQEKEVD
jgi:23S rRNA (guanine2445-N2)-methyltransferase / 23S rRNA (guanine2069-N7)-methyltransferase